MTDANQTAADAAAFTGHAEGKLIVPVNVTNPTCANQTAELTYRQAAIGEDAIAAAIRRGATFGVRCGCQECDQLLYAEMNIIWKAINNAAT